MPLPLRATSTTETIVAHPPIAVWHALTKPEHLYYWFGDAVEVDLRVGGAYIVRSTFGIRLDTTVERLVEGRRLVLRPTRRGDDARIEFDLVKLSGAETRVCVADPDSENQGPWRGALENLRSVWERGVDLREARSAVMGGEPPPHPERLVAALREAARGSNAKLERALNGLSDEDAYRPERPGAWSVAQVLAHLSITERMLQYWLDEEARGRRPAIDRDPCTTWRIAGALEGHPTVRELLQRIGRDEVETIALLAHIPADVASFKPRWGRVAFTALDFHSRGEDHLGQIARIRKAIGV